MARKHARYMQILVIPDDKDEPKTFTIPINRIKFYKILLVALVLHVVIGFFSYYQFFSIYNRNKELVDQNVQLESHIKRIDALKQRFESLSTDQEKIAAMLGLGHNGEQEGDADYPPVLPDAMPNSSSATNNEGMANSDMQAIVRNRIRFLKNDKSSLKYFENSIPSYLPVESDKGILTKDYENENYSGSNQHRGIDIAAATGTMVKAAADGVVLFSGWTFDLGNLLIVYHGNGYLTYYGHNQSLLVSRNAFVKKGDTISYLGSTGISSAPHLHFEIWKDGQSLDPKEYIRALSAS